MAIGLFHHEPGVIVAAPKRMEPAEMAHARVTRPTEYSLLSPGGPMLVAREPPAPEAPKRRLLDRVREALRTRQYSRRTEEAYIAWIRRYIFFHGKRHAVEMGGAEVTRFLSSLAVEGAWPLRPRTKR